MYVHCTYGYVRTLYVRTRTSKKLSLRMLSVPNPYVRACTYNVRTLYVHLPAGQEVVMQGTVMAAVMCARLIDTATENLENVGAGVQYGKVRVTTQMFQDDILQSSTNEETTQRVAVANEVFQDTNRMGFNMGKTQMMCIPQKQGQQQTVRINNQDFGRCTQYKYLGDHLHNKNNLDLNIEKKRETSTDGHDRNNSSHQANEHPRKRLTNKAKTV